MTAIDPNIEKTLAAAYDPLKDPASDGFVDLSKQAWKAGASGLDTANAAPLASDAERTSLKTLLLRSFAVIFALCVVGAVILHFYNKDRAHKAKVEAAQVVLVPKPIPQVTDKSTVQKRAKSSPENVANKATNTPASDGFYGLKPHEKPPEKSVKKPRIKDDFNAEFDKEQARFEANLKKEFP